MTKKVLFPLVAAALLVVTGCTPKKPAATSNVGPATSTEVGGNSQGSVTSQGGNVTTSQESVYTPDLSKKVNLKLSVHYQDDKTYMTFGGTSGYTNYKDPAGNTYKTGDLKPAWKAISNRLNIGIEDVHNGKDVAASYSTLKNDANGAFTGADILMGKASGFTDDGTAGDYFVNLLDYQDKMPNFSKFLRENPIVQLTITSNAYKAAGAADSSAIYFAPYFDGYDDLERMTMLRLDWVKLLLDGAPSYDTATTLTTAYTPAKTVKAREVTVPANIQGSSTKKITRAAVTNVIERMNALDTKNGATLAECLKTYIKEAYGDQYTNLSDLYCGYDAAYDADEFVALLRVVKANPQLLSGTNNVVPFYPRAYTNDRLADIYRWAGQLFGVRGLESRSNYLYVNKEGKVVDARGDLAVANVVQKLHEIYAEGLIATDFNKKGTNAGNFNDDYLKAGTGFATYDYCQTQTAYNNKVDRTNEKLKNFDFEPVLGAVNDMDDKYQGNYINFTESWRSVKTEGWGISKAAAADADKLDRCLALVDYFYSEAGNMLMSYGPEEYGYISKNADGSIKTIKYNGMDIPELSEAMLAQFHNIRGATGISDINQTDWNYTNYYRYWVGSTYPVGYVKQQGMEYQCTADEGKAGLEKIAANINAGTLKHPTVDNFTHSEEAGYDSFYDIVPTTFRLTKGQADEVATYTGLANVTSEKGKTCMFDNYVIAGYGATVDGATLVADPAAMVSKMEEWKVAEYSAVYNSAYKFMTESY